MSLNSSPRPPEPAPARSATAWILAVVLVGAAAAAVVAVSAFHSTPHGSLTVTDDFGRSVSVTPDPGRVIALGPNIVDIIDRLGLRSHLVGVDCYNGTTTGALESDYTPAQIALWNLSSAMCVEAYPFVPATLANLTPDLVLASTIVSISSLEQTTNELGIPLLVLQPDAPAGILYDDVLVGQIFGAGGAAASVNAQLSAELYNASVVTSSAFSFPTVLATYSVDPEGYWTFGPGSFGESLLELAGAASIGATATTAYPELSAAQVLAAQPQWIVYATGFGLDLSAYQGGPDWSSLSAVQHGNLSGIDSTLLTEPGPTMILVGLPDLLAVFHPA
jgi:iron complex transport system substrate-binding protein